MGAVGRPGGRDRCVEVTSVPRDETERRGRMSGGDKWLQAELISERRG